MKKNETRKNESERRTALNAAVRVLLTMPIVCLFWSQCMMLFDVEQTMRHSKENRPPAVVDIGYSSSSSQTESSKPFDLLSTEQPSENNNNHNNNTSNYVPNLLSPEQRSKNRLFVHIGKAGGSSIQVMVKKAHTRCREFANATKKGTVLDTDEKLVRDQVCALSKIPTGRVHIKERLHPLKFYSKYTQFLINVRDPIDRLVSWWNYEKVSFVREPRWSTMNKTGQASDNYRRLSRECYPGNASEDGFVQMVHDGLLNPQSPEQPGELEIDPSTRSCAQLARLCLRGDIMCFAHNYYNYEVYLEEILRRKGLSANTNNTETKGPPPKTIRIDALRAEHSMEDFDRTIGLWTSRTVDEWNKYPGVTPTVQSMYGRMRTIEKYGPGNPKKKKKQEEPQKQPPPELLSPKARTALCQHICAELVVYKTVLKASDNMDASHVAESYLALDDHCGFAVDAVCGTTWTFRDTKAQKKIFEEAPW